MSANNSFSDSAKLYVGKTTSLCGLKVTTTKYSGKFRISVFDPVTGSVYPKNKTKKIDLHTTVNGKKLKNFESSVVYELKKIFTTHSDEKLLARLNTYTPPELMAFVDKKEDTEPSFDAESKEWDLMHTPSDEIKENSEKKKEEPEEVENDSDDEVEDVEELSEENVEVVTKKKKAVADEPITVADMEMIIDNAIVFSNDAHARTMNEVKKELEKGTKAMKLEIAKLEPLTLRGTLIGLNNGIITDGQKMEFWDQATDLMKLNDPEKIIEGVKEMTKKILSKIGTFRPRSLTPKEKIAFMKKL